MDSDLNNRAREFFGRWVFGTGRTRGEQPYDVFAEACCPCECVMPRTQMREPSVRTRIYLR
ncbi:MAG TPA: hypothetical protein VFG89_05850 [Coriobacteriia bacterium]|nr:hypothetical protein [Coriobacteriia bacterium]